MNPETAAAEARRAYVLAHKANLARLHQLVEDAETKCAEQDNPQDAEYYSGVIFGLNRAISVLEGRG